MNHGTELEDCMNTVSMREKMKKGASLARKALAAAAMFAATCAFAGGAAYEHYIYDSMSLDGAWEMAYRSNSCVCSFNLPAGDPAAEWLKNRLVEYARSDAFEPAQSISVAQLRAVMETKRFSERETGLDKININTNDPATNVRKRN